MIEKLKGKGGKKICIICEGYEEKDYIDRLVDMSVFSNKYNIVAVNAKSINNIFSRCEYMYRLNSYNIIFIFCDTDKPPYNKYKEIKNKINKLYNAEVSDDIVVFGNPCTMQIILSHFLKLNLTSQSKSVNSKYIEEIIGTKSYKATEDQRRELFSKIKRDNYETMKQNVAKLSSDEDIVSSTNILNFLDKLENDDESWIDEINNKV